MANVSFDDIRKQFDESLGYIKNDVSALCRQHETVNYTVALLIACGCDFLAKGAGKHPHQVFAELLPRQDWKELAKPLYEALRNSLAHKFDTKHLHVDGQSIQIYFKWTLDQVVEIGPASGGIGLFIGPRPMGDILCTKIDEFRRHLQTDAAARARFRRAHESKNFTRCSTSETAAWKRLVATYSVE